VKVELRPPALDDAEALVDLMNRDGEELYGEPEESVDSMRMWLTGPTLKPETDIRVAVVDGTFRGYVDVDPDPEPIYWADLRVPPSEDDEVRVALYDWVEGRARERQGELLRFHTASVDEQTKHLLEARQYRVIRHFYRMGIDFDGSLAKQDWPEGMTVRNATREDAQLAYDVHQESFEDHWEHERMPFEVWAHHMLREGLFDLQLWFLVERDNDIAAAAICREHEGEKGLGWISVLGVRKQWRRQGLGRALLLHCFHEFRRRGFHAAALGVDAESLTGANKLYENAGMRVVRQSDVYEKAI
jgi:ribosomal protein S18 acetylase RimI-like enzyme